MDADFLPVVWAGLIAFAILVYVLLDGFDLGVGILFGTTRNEAFRERMMASIAPVWDGNETWLVLVGASLYAAFPMVYAIFLPAFYLPIALLLFGLIFRGVAFEFRHRTKGMRWLWDWGFFLGSLVVAFVQGAAIGAMVQELRVVDGRFAGGAFDWVSGFSILCGIGLVVGYSLLGATWLVLKTSGPLREWAYGWVGRLLVGVNVFLFLALVFALLDDFRVMDRWLESPWLLVFPAIGLAATYVLFQSYRNRMNDILPFAMTALIFIVAFLTMAGSFWPHMIPFSVTIEAAAAPKESLEFFLYGGALAFPIVLIYTAFTYWIFRGKVPEATDDSAQPTVAEKASAPFAQPTSAD